MEEYTMKISKRDALMWFSFFAQLDEEEPLINNLVLWGSLTREVKTQSVQISQKRLVGEG